MTQRNASRNNLIAGTFLIVSLVLAVVVAFALSDVQDRLVPTHPYTARFDISVGAAGLAPGSPVMVGGQRAGRVTDIDFARTRGDGGRTLPEAVLVHFRLREDLRIHKDAEVRLEVPLLGKGAQLNITGAGTTEAPLLEPGGTVQGTIAPPSFLAQAGFGPQEAERVRQILADFSVISDRTSTMLAELQPWITDESKGVVSVIADAKAITGDVRGRLPGWSERIDSVLANSDEISRKVGEIIDNARDAVQETRDAVAAARDIIDDNREEVDRIIAHLDSTMEKIDSETVEELNTALRGASEAATHASESMVTIMAWLEREMPGIRRILANARLAADQLKLTAIEVRRAPWRLLYQPGRKELAEEVLWSSARSYADAVSDLRAVSDALEAIAAAGEASPDSPDVQRLRSELFEAFERYKQAEVDFLQRLAEHLK